ncbi:putative reverse transcriptase domain-containing protein [Tanacetum coccineum]
MFSVRSHPLPTVPLKRYKGRFHELTEGLTLGDGMGTQLATEPKKNMQKKARVGAYRVWLHDFWLHWTNEAGKEFSKDRSGRDDNNEDKTGNCFYCNLCKNRELGEYGDCRVMPRNVNPVIVRNPTPVRGACHECRSTDHLKLACPRLNRAQGLGGNRPNQVVANNGGQGRGNQGNQARGRAFMLGVKEARQDSNIVTDAFTLNNHFATTLFDSGADYSFVSTTFIPLLGIEPSELGFRYEIEIASGQLVEYDKVIKGCKLEIEGHVFDIDLISFGHRSFDVIIGMDWLYNHKAEIIYHEKVVRIPLLDDNVLRVLGESREEKVRLLVSAKTRDKKQ